MKFKVLVFILCIGVLSFAQKKEKIKGNKFIKVVQHKIADFNELNLNENFEVYILKGKTPQIEIETDENLHETVLFTVNNDGVLSLSTTHKIISKKKLNIRITITEKFNSIIVRDKAIVNSLIDLNLSEITILAKDNAKTFLTIKTNEFKLNAAKNTAHELNLNTTNGRIQLSESSTLKALINATNLKVDLAQKTKAEIEGDVDSLYLKLDKNSEYKGGNLTAINAEIIAKGTTECDMDVKENLSIEALGNAIINIYNSPKIDLKKFEESAAIFKKNKL